ncbi:hypothetical protein BGZ72_000502 [Mortierella alpina]|nr:hypothetical protein BGZ72_000502 [Mortierella alpina]
MNENYDENFVPDPISSNILPTAPSKPKEPQWGDSDIVIEAWIDYEKAVSNVYRFTVCERCPQLLNPSSHSKHEDLPACAIRAADGARQYGVHAGTNVISKFDDLQTQSYEWVGARPSCRYHPHLLTFSRLERYQIKLETTAQLVGGRAYGSPPSLASMSSFVKQHEETMGCLRSNRSIYFVGDSHIRELFIAFTNRLRETDTPLTLHDWGTHTEQVEGVHIRQDFDQWLTHLQHKIRHTLGEPLNAEPDPTEELSLLEKFDSIILDFGAWPAAGFGIGPLWTSDHLVRYMRETLWDLAKVRHLRQEHYKQTGEGYRDLRIVWMGMVPWPETNHPDMRTNPRLKYWETLVNREIDVINNYYKGQGGMIDHLGAFEKIMPYHKLSADGAHYTAKGPVDALIQALIHKLDLCSKEFIPKFPPPVPEIQPVPS